MSSFDVCVRGGTVYTPYGPQEVDIYIQGEKVALLAARSAALPAREVVDATGKAVVPGLIDLHVHTREPGYTHKEDFLTASQAAAAGGVTTIVDMPNVDPPTDTVERFLEKRAMAEAKCIVDFGHFVSGVHAEEVPRLAEAGVTGFKIFQVSGAYPHDPRLALNDTGRLLDSFRAIARTGLLCCVHPFDQSLFDRLAEHAWQAGKPKDHITFSEIYASEVVWRSAVAVLLELQRESGVRLHLLHTHAPRSLELIRQAKDRGQRVTAEVDPKYFQFTPPDLQEKGPRIAPAGFVGADPARLEAIWRALRDGTIDSIGTDHAPHTLEEIERQRVNAWEAALGCPQLDDFFSVLLTDAHQGRISLQRLVQLLSEMPARLLGLFPQKGAIAPGSDADLVVVDLDREKTLSDRDVYTRVGWTPYAGRRVRGVPVLTMLRGQVIARDGRVVGKPGYGRFIQARPDPDGV